MLDSPTSQPGGRALAGMARLRASGVCVLAGLVAGLVAGLLARLDMRIVALTSGRLPIFTPGGTLNILFFGLIIGAAFGLGFAQVKRYVPGALRGGLPQGVLFGVALLAVIVLPLYLWQPDFREELALAPGHLGIALFGFLPLAYGALLGLAAQRLDRRMPAEVQPRSGTWYGFLGLLGLGAVGLLLVAYGIVLAVIEAGR